MNRSAREQRICCRNVTFCNCGDGRNSLQRVLIQQSAGQAAGKERWVCSKENNDFCKNKPEPAAMHWNSGVSLAIPKLLNCRSRWHTSPGICTASSLGPGGAGGGDGAGTGVAAGPGASPPPNGEPCARATAVPDPTLAF